MVFTSPIHYEKEMLNLECILRSRDCAMHFWFATCATGTLIPKLKQNKDTMGRNWNLSVTFYINLNVNITTHCELCKCVISLLQIATGNILDPIGMLYNAVLVQRQYTLIPW